MSLDADYDSSNIFARILSGAVPCVKVYEDDKTLSFMDVFPQARGHTLVIPKISARNLFDIADADLQDLIVKTRKVAQGVRDALQPEGVRLMQFNGAAAGQTVFHIHFHIIPFWEGTADRPHASGQMADMAELNETAALIRAKL